jgi:hypothetical protein
MSNDYQPTSEQITKMINLLRLKDPVHATEDWAVAILHRIHDTMDTMSFDDPERLDQIIEDLNSKRKNI